MAQEDGVAKRIRSLRRGGKGLLGYAGLVGAVFIVLNMTSSSIGAPQAVIHVGTQTSVAKYLGQFDDKSRVVMLGATTSQDWVGIKLPFKGHLSDLRSITFSEFVAQTGGLDSVEPYVVIKLPEGKSLVCDPVLSYRDGVWDLPLFEWQMRDTVAMGKWVFAPVDTKSMLVDLSTWIQYIGDEQVISVSIYIGMWDLTSVYQVYIGDIALNGRPIDLANAARCSTADLPPGF